MIQITISNEEIGYKLYKENSQYPLENFRNSFLSKFLFFEDDIYNLLGENKYDDFENGRHIFEISKKHLELIIGLRCAQTKEEIEMYND